MKRKEKVVATIAMNFGNEGVENFFKEQQYKLRIVFEKASQLVKEEEKNAYEN